MAQTLMLSKDFDEIPPPAPPSRSASPQAEGFTPRQLMSSTASYKVMPSNAMAEMQEAEQQVRAATDLKRAELEAEHRQKMAELDKEQEVLMQRIRDETSSKKVKLQDALKRKLAEIEEEEEKEVRGVRQNTAKIDA